MTDYVNKSFCENNMLILIGQGASVFKGRV
jgi:hypothetical protein